jgi:L-serine dehydratase
METSAPRLVRIADAPLSVTDLYTIGIGPSSSHTVGPMKAAALFGRELLNRRDNAPARILIELFGSLALTGKGHSTDVAVILGLMGWMPETVDPESANSLVDEVRKTKTLPLNGGALINFDEARDLIFRMGDFHQGHPNAVSFTAFTNEAAAVSRTFFSIGGGAIVEEGAAQLSNSANSNEVRAEPYPFSSAADLLSIGRDEGITLAQIVLNNERALRSDEETFEFLDNVHDAMMGCIDRGCTKDGILPGGLNVKRRAMALYNDLNTRAASNDRLLVLDWVSLHALAVNEENAAGGRVVTAPTNGAAGVIPAVLKYYETFCDGIPLHGSRTFLLTAAAIGMLYKRRASISAAEMGCQGEVGVACSMAAAGLTAALGGTNEQIENAAEIGMEHNLGLTCDPIKGLVQIPCIERNTMGAIKAINASRLALLGDGSHVVSLDAVIETMRQTGKDMHSKYKETSLGGLAVNVVEC